MTNYVPRTTNNNAASLSSPVTIPKSLYVSSPRLVNTQVVNSVNEEYTLPIIKLKCVGLPISGLLDTGASVSLIQDTEFKKIQNDPIIKMSDVSINIKSISGDSLKILGAYLIPITINNKHFKHKFYVTENQFPAHYQAVLGYDFLTAHNFILDLKDNTLLSHNTKIAIPKINLAAGLTFNNNIYVDYARLASKTTLLPKESTILPLKLDMVLKPGEDVLFTPDIKNEKLEIHTSLCSVDSKKKLMVPVANLSTETITLNKNMKVGHLSSDVETRDLEHIKQLRREELKESDFKLDHLDADTRTQLLRLLFEYSDIFSKRLYTIGRTTAITPQIQADVSQLNSVRPYPVPYMLQPQLKQQLDELEAADLIEKSDSHFSFPLIMVKKRTSSDNPQQPQKYRLVVDYRQLNTNIKYQRYKLPLINQLLENLSGSKLFCALDLTSSFYQIPLKPQDRDLTSFNSIFGCQRFKVMPMGISPAPETFSILADKLLKPLEDLKISNFIDDFCLGAQDTEQMLTKLRKLFEQFRQYGLTLNPEKCIFFVPEIEFLGHKLSGKGIKPLDTNIRKITDFPMPNTVKKIRRFMGLVGYYRRFIEHFSEITAPLTELTKKRRKFQWNPQAEQAFNELKTKLSQPPILTHPDFNKEFVLSTDASETALGACLGQMDESGCIHPISYWSKKLNPTQIKYTIYEKELLAIHDSIKSYKYYLFGNQFTIRCDNAAITKLKTLESPGNRVTRWFCEINRYNYKFDNIRSEDNQIADILSRDFHVNAVQIDLPTLEDIKIAQHTDPQLSKIISEIKNSTHRPSKTKPYYELQNDLLVHISFLARAGRKIKATQTVIPNRYKPHILAANHLSHFGHYKTYQAIREKYFWTNMYADTKNYVQSCKICMSYKSPNRIAPAPLQRHYLPSRPSELVSCDFIGKLYTTDRGNSYILTFIDHFTKFIKLYAVPDQTAETTADKFLDYATTFGFPAQLLSDRGTNFLSETFQLLCSRLGVTKLNTSPRHPSSNGQSEVINKSIKKSLAIFAQETAQWDNYLNFYELFYNSSLHTAVNDTPAYLQLGYDVSLPTDIIQDNPPTQTREYPDYVRRKTKQMQYTYKKVYKNIKRAAEIQEIYQHKFSKERTFHPGDLVFLHAPDMDRNAHLPKKRQFRGPFRVLKSFNKVNYSILDIQNAKAKPYRVHVDRIIPVIPRNKNLEYLENVVRNQDPILQQDEIFTRPHATFDDLTEEQLLMALSFPPADATQTAPNAVIGSPASDTTELYDFAQNPPSHHTIQSSKVQEKATQPQGDCNEGTDSVIPEPKYCLRNRVVPASTPQINSVTSRLRVIPENGENLTVASRIFNHLLTLTEPTETPQFLQWNSNKT